MRLGWDWEGREEMDDMRAWIAGARSALPRHSMTAVDEAMARSRVGVSVALPMVMDASLETLEAPMA